MKIGLIKRKETWRLTLRGWLALLLTLTAVAVSAVHLIYPFLALTSPVRGDLLVVEGWIPDYSLADLRAEFELGGYKLLVVTGNPMLKGEVLSEYKNFADLTKAILLKNGWAEDKVVAVPSSEVLRDRTYASALALKAWLAKSGTLARSLTVFSKGSHARRSWLLYRIALKDHAQVGVIASEDRRYDPQRWWTTSEGVRDIIDETIAYLYARLLFRPDR